MKFEEIAGFYQRAFKKHGDSDDAVLFPKGRQFVRFNALLRPALENGCSVMDFGCGLGKLKSYLNTLEPKIKSSYIGVDMVPEFIEECRSKFPDSEFILSKNPSELPDADIVIASGTFNLKTSDYDIHKKFVFSALESLFAKSKKCLCFDFMHDRVDFQLENSFHLPISEALSFVETKLSPRYDFKRSFLPFEAGFIVYKSIAKDGQGVYI